MHVPCVNMDQISLSLFLNLQCVTSTFGKGSQEVSDTVSNQFEILSIYPSVCFFFRFLSFSLSFFLSLSLSLSLFLSLHLSLHHIYLPIILSQSLRCGSSAARNLNNYHISQMLHLQFVKSIPLDPQKKNNGMRRLRITRNLY